MTVADRWLYVLIGANLFAVFFNACYTFFIVKREMDKNDKD